MQIIKNKIYLVRVTESILWCLAMLKGFVDAREKIDSPRGKVIVYRLEKLEEIGLTRLSKLPFTIRILLENVTRNYDGFLVREEDIKNVGRWPSGAGKVVVPFMPSRVILQDYTGVPAVVDLAAMREIASKFGCDPSVVDTQIPAHLVVDHSISVDYFGTSDAFKKNTIAEFRKYRERYRLLKWAQTAFANLKIIPPGKGIIHQVNVEYLAQVVHYRKHYGELVAYPDTLVGADSHTTMVNGIGVLGWGAGGIEVEAVMLGQPYYTVLPEVVGVKLVGEPREGVTPTDIVLAITEFLRKKVGDVVGKFVEFYGPSVKALLAFDRVTIANMSPEYGSTVGFFPVDKETIEFLRTTGRDPKHIDFVEWYTKLQYLYYDSEGDPEYSISVTFDLSDIEPSLAGPSHPEDRVALKNISNYFVENLSNFYEESKKKRLLIGKSAKITQAKQSFELEDGAVVIASITSCTNTSNPHVMLGAGLVAKKAVEKGLTRKPWVKTSLSPGSRVVAEYLKNTGLMPYLEAVGFHVTGFGCMTCIGNSGPLPSDIAKAIRENNLYTVAVLSGNRNFSGRIHPLVKANFLASPMLVVVYALKGTMKWDPYREPIDYTPNGEPVYLKDIWPSTNEIRNLIREYVRPELYRDIYKDIYRGTEEWEKLDAPRETMYQWDEKSTFIRRPPFFDDFSLEPSEPDDIIGARVLVMLGDRVTTDHISPAGTINPESPAGQYLLEKGVELGEFGTYGARRGNHEVMMRGTFANPRLRNLLVDREGGYTIYWPTREITTIFDAAMRYRQENIPLIVIAGKQYGAGSSRDWAAKGPYLLGVRAIIAESFERIHRSNLIGMGILPLQFIEGENASTLGLRGDEIYDIIGIREGLYPNKILTVRAKREDGTTIEFKVVSRLDNQVEVEYYRHGGILKYVLRNLIKSKCMKK